MPGATTSVAGHEFAHYASPASVSHADRAHAELEELVVTLAFPPGTFLTERALCERLGLGRTPVREAVLRLAAERLVTVLPRRGVLISELNAEQQLLATEVRRELERLLATRAARRARSEERERSAEMADAIVEATECDDEIAFLRLDREFDELLLGCAGNPFASKAIAPLHAMSRRFWFANRVHMSDMREMGSVHAEVLRAIAAGAEREAAAAADRMMDFVDSFTHVTLARL